MLSSTDFSIVLRSISDIFIAGLISILNTASIVTKIADCKRTNTPAALTLSI